MSRHRAVRNLNLDDELADDDYDSQNPYDDISEEDAAQLEESMSNLISVMESNGVSRADFSNREIKDTLWDAYFDVDQAFDVLLEKQRRRENREKKKAENSAKKQSKSAPSSKPGSGASTPSGTNKSSARPQQAESVSQLRQDIEGLGLSKVRGVSSTSTSEGSPHVVGGSIPGTPRYPGGNGIPHEKVIEEFQKVFHAPGAKKRINLVVVGHVDAGKSTLMGRLLHLLGSISDRQQTNNERASAKAGKGSFAYAWALDSSEEERKRGVTIDVAQDNFATEHRAFTLLDAPGHRDFIPNMISGAAQADAALLVVDAVTGAFEAGFGPNGQTREHALLVRSLGVQQLVVVVNKLDAVDYDAGRFHTIVNAVRPFLASSGFDLSKVSFVPCGTVAGENLESRNPDGTLSVWYKGLTLVQVLDQLEPPERQLDGAFRMPLTNVFKAGQTAISSGVGASGRIVSGVVSIGDRVCVVPGEELASVKAIEQGSDSVPWAVAGSSVTLYLSSIDIIFLNIGRVLCSPTDLVPTTTTFVAQILVFEPSLPLLAGTTLDLHHHSSNLSVTLSELIATLDIKTGQVLKQKPRVLGRGVTAKVRITTSQPLAIEAFTNNRDLGRVLLRLHGETVAAGIVQELV